MLKNGHVFSDVLNAGHSISVQNAGISGQVHRATDRSCQSEVLVMVNDGKVRVPRTNRHSLDLPFTCLVLQLFIPSEKLFSIEISVTDSSSVKRRLVFSHCRDLIKNALSAKIPVESVVRDKWNNLCLFLPSFMSECWGTALKRVDSIILIGNCRIRRVFALNIPLRNSENSIKGDVKHDILPAGHELPENLEHVNQCVTATSVKRHQIEFRSQEVLGTIKLPRKGGKPEEKNDLLRKQHKGKVGKKSNDQQMGAPQMKSQGSGFFDAHSQKLTRIRHHTLLLVNDPIGKKYLKYTND